MVGTQVPYLTSWDTCPLPVCQYLVKTVTNWFYGVTVSTSPLHGLDTGSIPVRTTRVPVYSLKTPNCSYSVVVSTEDFESSNLGSSPSKTSGMRVEFIIYNL